MLPTQWSASSTPHKVSTSESRTFSVSDLRNNLVVYKGWIVYGNKEVFGVGGEVDLVRSLAVSGDMAKF